MSFKGGIARLISIFLICAVIIAYNAYSNFIQFIPSADSRFAMTDGLNNTHNTDNSVSQPESSLPSASESNVDSKAESTSTDKNAVTTATVGNYKGKIISNYISPYKSGLSYDKVFVKNSTTLKPDLKSLLNAPLSFKIQQNSSPQVLIMHTHTTETFMTESTDYYTDAFSSRSRDTEKNMVSIGKIVAEKLNSAGIVTLHDTTEHDYPKYTGSYTRAAATINGYLKKYPDIKIVLDLHRDAVSSGESDKVKLVTEINGKKTAQVMLVMGSQSGGVTNFPNWEENFKLALKLQQVLETDYPTLARPVSLTSNNYNESLTKGSLLIEFGTDANTLEEVHYSAQLVGNALAKLLLQLR